MTVKNLESKFDLLPDGTPKDKSYFEVGLPGYLKESIDLLNRCDKSLRVDLYQDNLYGDINSAFIDKKISKECADYLRQKYLARDYVPFALRDKGE